MAENSKIEWTDHTFNPWRGCAHRVLPDGTPHPGCENCYAAAMAPRNPKTLGVWGEEEKGKRVYGSAKYWRLPLKWDAAAKAAGRIDRVFCASLADVFEDWKGPLLDINEQRLWVDRATGRDWQPETPHYSFAHHRPAKLDDARRTLFGIIDHTPNLFWLLLTKRPENVRRMWPSRVSAGGAITAHLPTRHNVAIGTSISDQATADELVPQLLKSRDLAPVLFLSVEPLVGPVDLALLPEHHKHPSGDPCMAWTTFNNCLTGFRSHKQGGWTDENFRVDWVIVGGESGHHARPMHPQWARDLRDQCTAAGVPFFFKQWGEWLPFASNALEDTLPATFAGNTPVCLVKRDGRVFRPYSLEHAPGHEMARVGKHAAGRLLDGREWNELPAAFSPAEVAR